MTTVARSIADIYADDLGREMLSCCGQGRTTIC